MVVRHQQLLQVGHRLACLRWEVHDLVVAKVEVAKLGKRTLFSIVVRSILLKAEKKQEERFRKHKSINR